MIHRNDREQQTPISIILQVLNGGRWDGRMSQTLHARLFDHLPHSKC